MLGDFYSNGVAQIGLFDKTKPHPNSAQLMAVIDAINKAGKGRIWFAGEGKEKGWDMRPEMLSPAYTTKFSDLIRVR